MCFQQTSQSVEWLYEYLVPKENPGLCEAGFWRVVSRRQPKEAPKGWVYQGTIPLEHPFERKGPLTNYPPSKP